MNQINSEPCSTFGIFLISLVREGSEAKAMVTGRQQSDSSKFLTENISFTKVPMLHEPHHVGTMSNL